MAVISVAGLALGQAHVQEQILAQMRGLLGDQGAALVGTMLESGIALIFRFLADVRLRWRDVATGAAVTSLLFAVGKIAIGFYLGRAVVGSAYGAAGSLAIVLCGY